MAGETPEIRTGMSRELGLVHITLMGMGMMIGAGVFIGIGLCLSEAGPGGMMLTFAFNGVIALITAMGYAELSSAIPKAGGAYNYARIAFGKRLGFLAGWLEWFASSVAGSLYAVTFATYVHHFAKHMRWVPDTPTIETVMVKTITVVVAVLFVYINYRGVSETGKAGAIITIGQTGTLALIALVGLIAVHRQPERLANFQPFLPNGWGKILLSMGLIYVAFEGFEVIAQTGDEAIDPRRNLPKAMLYSIMVVVLTYVAVGAATLVSVHGKDLIAANGDKLAAWEVLAKDGKTAFATAVSSLLPHGGGLLVLLAVVCSSTSALNATIYSATRVSYALGRDQMLPPAFARISQKRKIPHIALCATSVLVLVMAVALPIEEVAASASAMFLMLFLIVNVCVIKVRRQFGDELTYGFVMPLFPLLPVVAIVMQIFMCIGLVKLSPVAWIAAGAWLALAVAVYFTYSRKHATEPEVSIVTFEEERAPETRPLSILLPVANPANALHLIRPTLILAKARDAEVDLLHMVPIPEQTPLSDAPQYMVQGEEALGEALLYTFTTAPTHRTIQYCRNVARGILSAARQRNTSMLILGWRGQSHRRDFVLGSTIDPILEKAPCDVLVVKDWPKGKIERVLVPVAGGPHTRLAIEVAALFAKQAGGRVTPFNVSRSERTKDAAQRRIEEAIEATGRPRELLDPKFVQADNVLEAILAETPGYDMVVLGASHERMWQQLVMGSIPEEIAQRCDKPAAMVKAKIPLKSWVRKWI